MPKKRRSTKVMFASTVLVLEAFVAFFATLAVFGLRRDEFPPAVILSVGIVLSLVLVLTCAVLSKPWGVALGWILQLVLILTGFLEPMMFVVGDPLCRGLVVRHPDRHPDRPGGRPARTRTGRVGRRAPRRRNQLDLFPKPHQPHWSSCEH